LEVLPLRLLTETADALLQENGLLLLLDEAPFALSTGKIHIGRFAVGEPTYTLENDVLSYEQTDQGARRATVVNVDGNDDSWIEYDRTSLFSRDEAVVTYLDLPELMTPGAVRQRAAEELQQTRSGSSPGGDIAGEKVLITTRLDQIFWIDENGVKYQARIEGKRVAFSQGLEPVQHASIDTGALVWCPPGAVMGTYIARDDFERTVTSGLGDALTGGTWVIYT